MSENDETTTETAAEPTVDSVTLVDSDGDGLDGGLGCGLGGGLVVLAHVAVRPLGPGRPARARDGVRTRP